MINVLVDDAFLFAIGHVDLVLNDLDRAVWTSGFTNPATGATVFVVIVVRHDHFALEPVIHFQRFPVFRILLGHDLRRAEEDLPVTFIPVRSDLTP